MIGRLIHDMNESPKTMSQVWYSGIGLAEEYWLYQHQFRGHWVFSLNNYRHSTVDGLLNPEQISGSHWAAGCATCMVGGDKLEFFQLQAENICPACSASNTWKLNDIIIHYYLQANELHYFNLDDLEFKEVIGHGIFLVFKGTKAGKNVAVKRVECEKNAIPREVEIHSSLPPHPNILPFLGVTHSRDGFSVYMCLELADKSLEHFLYTEMKKPSLKKSTNWAMQIAKGMQHLHEHGVVHCDLKSACILLF